MSKFRRLAPWLGAAAIGASLLAGSGTSAQDSVEARRPHRELAAELERWIAAEMEAKRVPAVSVALVEGSSVVWARGFGHEDDAATRACTAGTVQRVGSVSKLFTAIAFLQLVEEGKVALDDPVRSVIPDFEPKNRWDRPITFRQLLSHRSGMVRETPVGHYFDATAPPIEAIVASLNRTELVYEPETRTKYSNAAPTVVGRAVEILRGEPFAEVVRRRVLDPIGMGSSDFLTSGPVGARVARGEMWTYDGRTFDAPTFPIATGPAGNLYSTAVDLALFLATLHRKGGTDRGPILRPETLRSMWEPQFAGANGSAPFGLGFALGTLDGHRRVGHGGAVYGFATELTWLPDDGLGAVVIIAKDGANGLARRIAETALRGLIRIREGKPPEGPERTEPVPLDLARRLEGRYAAADGPPGEPTAPVPARDPGGFDLVERGGRLISEPGPSGLRLEIRLRGDDLVADDLLTYGSTWTVVPHRGLRRGDRLFENVTVPKPPAPCPESWAGLIGEYGWDHNVLYIYEKDGRLRALIEWFFDDPLTEVGTDSFRFPDAGLYDHESLGFRRDASGRVTEVEAAGVVFPRRRLDGEDGATFRIRPLRPVAELRPPALAATPPEELGPYLPPDLVDPATLEPGITLEIRYATADNFLGIPVYDRARAFLQRPAAEALVRAHRRLARDGFGLRIHDAYRPWSITKLFFEATPPEHRGFVADPALGSKHNRGSAIDLTLYELATGKSVQMVGGYDEFSPRSDPDYPGGTTRQRWARDLLRRAMEDEGFTVNDVEWWHFDFRDWSKYRIENASFAELERATARAEGR